ncbi:hypothetical protein LJC11_05325, partial [Bacteroidales bacterium OttesenSCG-928-I21]|nr:hypothetical protein [Bacteroidales bacterium OttesenSCG-928-I21]
FAGATLGGGHHKHILNTGIQKPDNNEDIYFLRQTNVIVGVPFVGIEFPVSQRIHIVTKIDMITYLSQWKNTFAKGVRLYVGFLFNK